jgi:hypothetical protein
MGYVPTGDADVASQVNWGVPLNVSPSVVYVNAGTASPYSISTSLAVNVKDGSYSIIVLKFLHPEAD